MTAGYPTDALETNGSSGRSATAAGGGDSASRPWARAALALEMSDSKVAAATASKLELGGLPISKYAEASCGDLVDGIEPDEGDAHRHGASSGGSRCLTGGGGSTSRHSLLDLHVCCSCGAAATAGCIPHMCFPCHHAPVFVLHHRRHVANRQPGCCHSGELLPLHPFQCSQVASEARPFWCGPISKSLRSHPPAGHWRACGAAVAASPPLPSEGWQRLTSPYLGLLAPTPSKLQVIGVGVLSLPFSVSWLGWVAGIAMMLLFAWITQVGC